MLVLWWRPWPVIVVMIRIWYDVWHHDKPSFDESTAVYGSRWKVFDKYGIWCQYNVPTNDLFICGRKWTGHQVLLIIWNTRKANAEYIVKTLDFLKWNDKYAISILDEYLGYILLLKDDVPFLWVGGWSGYTSKEDYPSIEEFESLWVNGNRYCFSPVGPELINKIRNFKMNERHWFYEHEKLPNLMLLKIKWWMLLLISIMIILLVIMKILGYNNY